jgi:sugar lactone lactonase YvrE
MVSQVPANFEKVFQVA